MREILRKHVRALGQLDVYQRLSSYLARGSLTQSGVPMSFTLYKRDGRMRMELMSPDKAFVILYDGQDAWQWQEKPTAEAVLSLNETQTAWLAQEARFEDLLATYDEKGFQAEYLGRVVLPESGQEANHIRLTKRFQPVVIDCYLNTVSHLEIQREYRPHPEAEPLVTRFSDYRTVDGIMVPYRVDSWMGGSVLVEVTLNEVVINPGILRMFFQKPKDLPVIEQSGPSP